MNVQIEFYMLNHEETCFSQKLNHFHEFWMKNVNAIHSWLVSVMESSMNEKLQV